MYINGIIEFKWKILTSSCLIFLLARLILIVDSARLGNPSTTRQMCTKLQSMLSFGKYQTSQISSNVTYTSRLYAQNFLAYSSIDDLLIFIEPKQQIHVYNAQTIELLANLTTTDVVIATSTTSLISESRHELYFMYENHSTTNLISLRLCQVRFNLFKLLFEDNFCVETINIQYDQPELRVNGFTIKRNHAGTKKSLLFISTDIGLVYTTFDTSLGTLIGESTIMNETLNEGSIVLSSMNVLYYASKQEHLIYELHIQRDFRLRYGKIIKTNAIKYPFGLITDECNHLYIATRSMILVMYAQNRATIRSVFSKASDLPITLERLNSTTYVYATVKKHSTKTKPDWMFNFLYFTDPERATPAPRHPAINLEEKLDFNDTVTNNDNIAVLLPLSYWLPSSTNASRQYIQYNSGYRKPFARFQKKNRQPTEITLPVDQDISSTNETKPITRKPLIADLNDDFQSNNPDENLDIDDNAEFDYPEPINQSLDKNPDLFSANSSKSVTPIEPMLSDSTEKGNLTLDADAIFSKDEIQSYLEGRSNLTLSQQAQIQAYIAQQSPSNGTIYSKYSTTTQSVMAVATLHDSTELSLEDRNTSSQNYSTRHPSSDFTVYPEHFDDIVDVNGTRISRDDLQSYLEGRSNLSASQETLIKTFLARQSSSFYNIFSRYSKTTTNPSETVSSNETLLTNSSTNNTSTFNENLQLESYLKYLNSSTDAREILFSYEDLKSYLQGNANISAAQLAQIDTYLANQSSSSYNLLSTYSTSTKKPRRTLIPGHSRKPKRQRPRNLTLHEDGQLDDYSEELLPSDLISANHTTETDAILFSEDDVQSYLQGRANLSLVQQAQIRAYLAKHSSSPHSLFSGYTTTTKKPRRTSLPSRGNLSLTDGTQSEDYSEELLPSNLTPNTDQTWFSEDDVQSYLQGRTNLSLVQQAQIQAYLEKQSSSSYNSFSKYWTSTKKPRRTYIPIHGMLPEYRNLTDNDQLEDYSEELLPPDPTSHNRTTESEEILFSNDHLLSYLERRTNLSTIDLEKIRAYLFKQRSFNRTIFTKYRNKTNLPSGMRPSDNHTLSDYQGATTQSRNDLTRSPLADSKYFNFSTGQEEVLFTDDDLKSYLQGRGNLSLAQEKQIQAYLSKESSSTYNPSYRYSTSIKKPRKVSIPTRTMFSEYKSTGSPSPTVDDQPVDYPGEPPPFNHVFDDHTTDYEETLFSDDDLLSYLGDRANLTRSDLAKIRAYLTGQNAYNQTVFSKDQNTTKLPSGIHASDNNTHPGYANGTTQAENYLTRPPFFDSKNFSLSIEYEGELFSEDDVKAYLQGRTNLSLAQEQRFQAYLSKQSSSAYNLLSRYPTSTKQPRRVSMPDRSIPPEYQSTGNPSPTVDIPPSDLKFYNRTTESKETLFSNDDLLSYLESRTNLSRSDLTKIRAYLSRQRSFNRTTISTDRNKTRLLTGTQASSDYTQAAYQNGTTRTENYLTRPPLFDSKNFNISTDQEQVLFTEDDLKSYLQGRANLSKQSSSTYIPTSRYSTSTKNPRRISIPSRSVLSEYQSTGNPPLIHDTQPEDYPEELPPPDFTFYNHTADSEQTLFSDDDLLTYLEGRSNLSRSDLAQIRAHLSRQKPVNQTIVSTDQNKTRLSTGIYASDNHTDSDDENEATQSRNVLTRPPLFDSKNFNFSTDQEEVLFSEDDLKSYLQGRANLSSAQEIQIQAYLSKQSSSTYNPSYRYSTSTKRPRRASIPSRSMLPQYQSTGNLTHDTQQEDYSEELLSSDLNYHNHTTDSKEILFSDDDLLSYLEGRSNLSRSDLTEIEAYLSRQRLFNQTKFSKDRKKTKLPAGMHASGGYTQPVYQNGTTQSRNALTKPPFFDSKHFNLSREQEEVLFSEDDLNAFLQGRANLSLTQEKQIRAYFSKQSSSAYIPTSRYSTTTKKSRTASTRSRTMMPEYQSTGNLTHTTQPKDYSEELLPSNFTSYDQMTGSEQALLSNDDLLSYLEGRSNLSRIELGRIRGYLSRQRSTNQTIFPRDRNKATLPTEIYASDNHTHSYNQNDTIASQNHLTRPPFFDSKYFNFSTDLEEVLFTEDDLKSYLQGRANLSLAQEAQIQAYLEKKILSDNKTSSSHQMSTTKPTKIFTSEDKLSVAARQKLTSTKSYTTKRRTSGRQFTKSVINGTDHFNTSIEQPFDASDEYPQVSRPTSPFSHLHTDRLGKMTKRPSMNKDNDNQINSSRRPTKFRSTTRSRLIQTTPQQARSTIMGSIPLNKTSKPALSRDPSVTNADYTSSNFIGDSQKDTTNMMSFSTEAVSSVSQIDMDQTQISSTLKSYEDTEDHLNSESIHTSTLSTSITSNTVNSSETSADVNSNNVDNEISHKYSSPLFVTINISSTPHTLLSSTISNTILPFTHRSRSPTSLHYLLTSSSTKSRKYTQSSSSKLFSVSDQTTPTPSSEEITSIESEPTTMLSYSTIIPSSTSELQSSQKFSPMQTTDIAVTSDRPKRKSITTPSATFYTSVLFTTHHARSESTMSLLTTGEQSFSTKSNQYISKSLTTPVQTSSVPYTQSTKMFATLFPSTHLDFWSTKSTDITSSRSTLTTIDEDSFVGSDNRLSETTETLPSTELPSTMLSHYSKSKTLSTIMPTILDKIHSSSESTIRYKIDSPTTSTTTTTTSRRYRTRKQKTTSWQTPESTTTTTTTTTTTVLLYLTTTIYDHQPVASTMISTWPPELNPLEGQEKLEMKPPFASNDSNILLTNDLLNKIFNNYSTSGNSSSEKSIFLNLMNHPPSSWNLSLNSNESIFLDIALPILTNWFYPNATTNLTFTNIEADRFKTNIIGIPIHLQVDRVQARQFSLTMDATDNSGNQNRTNQHFSDVIIGHVRSEQFELNLTKSDKMHVHVQQVDSATAELYLDSNFCTNDSSLEINLNLSKNGTIRYGNRKPIHIGPVFTRVHMLKQSCDREQPLTLFFDICERENPCSNGGRCLSVLPDYNDPAYVPSESGHIGYKCQCPSHASGEHCQYLEYPLGYCLNGGTLFQIFDRFNKSIEQCICSLGFRGEHCEENIDNCVGISCSDHGVCEDGIETYKCSCFDGFYGFHCERTNVQAILLRAASRSFGVLAILLIAGIAGLVVTSDIHTYLTRKQQRNSLLNKIPRVTSELFENSVLLLGFSDAPIEMNNLNNIETKKRLVVPKQRQTRRTTTRNRRPTSYRQIIRRRTLTTFSKSTLRRSALSSRPNQTFL